MDRVDSIREQTGNVSRDGNPKKEPRRIKNAATEMKNVFDGLISRLDMAEERISELEDIAVETSEAPLNLKSKENKDGKNRTERLRTVGKLQRI